MNFLDNLERICAFPKCERTLSELMPVQIKYCGVHQRDFIIARKDFNVPDLPDKDVIFIIQHYRGCYPKHLSTHLEFSHDVLGHHIRQGRIKTKKDRHNSNRRIIPLDIMIHLIRMRRFWLTAAQLCRAIDVKKSTFLKYARAGWFGPKQINFQKRLVLSKKWEENLEGLRQRFEETKRDVYHQRRCQKNIDPQNILLVEIARHCLITDTAVYYWARRGIIPAHKDGGRRWVVSHRDFIEFLQKVNRGETQLKPQIQERLKMILQTVRLRTVRPS